MPCKIERNPNLSSSAALAMLLRRWIACSVKMSRSLFHPLFVSTQVLSMVIDTYWTETFLTCRCAAMADFSSSSYLKLLSLDTCSCRRRGALSPSARAFLLFRLGLMHWLASIKRAKATPYLLSGPSSSPSSLRASLRLRLFSFLITCLARPQHSTAARPTYQSSFS